MPLIDLISNAICLSPIIHIFNREICHIMGMIHKKFSFSKQSKLPPCFRPIPETRCKLTLPHENYSILEINTPD